MAGLMIGGALVLVMILYASCIIAGKADAEMLRLMEQKEKEQNEET